MSFWRSWVYGAMARDWITLDEAIERLRLELAYGLAGV
jgi:hypothetical protein